MVAKRKNLDNLSSRRTTLPTKPASLCGVKIFPSSVIWYPGRMLNDDQYKRPRSNMPLQSNSSTTHILYAWVKTFADSRSWASYGVHPSSLDGEGSHTWQESQHTMPDEHSMLLKRIDDIITSRGYKLGRNSPCLGEINLAESLTSALQGGRDILLSSQSPERATGMSKECPGDFRPALLPISLHTPKLQISMRSALYILCTTKQSVET